MGTFCFTFSQLLRDDKIIENLYFNKNVVYSIHYRIIEGGFHFSKFGDEKSIIKKITVIPSDIDNIKEKGETKQNINNVLDLGEVETAILDKYKRRQKK